MEHNLILVLLFVILSIFNKLNEVQAGYCQKAYSCSNTCYTSARYYEGCGFLWLGRCTRYRSQAGTCYSLCYTQECCAGYTGNLCSTPICSQSCSSNGYCSYPETCSCYSGYKLLSDGRTCEDINECTTGSSGCQQGCTNTKGSFECSCNIGYELSWDRKSCNDIDECSRGTSGCQQSCTNTPGSYTCSCNSGFQIGIDGKTCSDIDECSARTAVCDGFCVNTYGSYQCSCGSGFVLAADGKTCNDVNECNNNNGGCQQDCINRLSSYECQCRKGFEPTSANSSQCADIDECTRGISGCSQQCKNSEGSYTCICEDGYQLLEDGKTCSNINDCTGVVCQNGGTCIDGVGSYVCSCRPGFISDHCELDVNECDILNGGCQEACVNTDGSFHCACFNGKQLAANGVSCSTDDETIFDCDSFSWGYLPDACFSLPLALCTNGNDNRLELTSTSPWYTKTDDHSIYFTFGITYIHVSSLSLPISLRGVEVTLIGSQFQLRHGVSYKSSDGSVLEDANNQNQCQTFELAESDIFNYISCGSFFKTFLKALFPSFPDWISFDKSSDSVLAVQGMKSDLAWGRDINDILWCKGAPTFGDHLYSVFQFDSTFILEVLGQQLHIPKPLSGRKFCLIIDICQDNGKTIFLMIPEESRNMLEQFNFFRNLKEEKNLRVLPRGIGLSLAHGINVHSKSRSLQLWNGDTIFQYPISQESSVWIGGDAALTTEHWIIDGSIDAFLSVPSMNNLLTSIFYDEWNAFISASAKIQLKFDLFGKTYTLVLKHFASATMETYMSVGGQKRLWCGEESNPPGFFLTVDIETSLFKGIPILGDSDISSAHKAYAFATSEPAVEFIDFDEITEKEFAALRSLLQNISLHLEETMKSQDIIFRNTTNLIITDVRSTISDFRNTIDSNSINSFEKVKQIFEKSLEFLTKLDHHIELFLRETEGNIVVSLDNFKKVVEYELTRLKFNTNQALAKISRRLVTIQPNFSGFGLKYRAKLNVLGLNLGDFDIELVYSTDSLFKCSRFQKIIDHLKDEKALRILAREYVTIQLHPFFTLEGGGVGGAFSSVSEKFVIQLEVIAKILGIIDTTADLFITRNGLYLYTEGKVWDIFLAQLDIFAETGKQWHELTLKVSGRFLVKDRRKRHIQTVSSSFEASYLDGLKKAINFIADSAKARLSQVQERFTSAQNAFTKAQNWLEEKQKDVRNADDKFTQAVSKLEIAKQNLEQAKGPFQEALRKLESAQRNVDNLCTIKTCDKVCVPGFRLKWCGGWFKYPCFEWTNCMISFPNPLCEAANLLCYILRAAAYAALEVAKIFVKAPMLALDIAKAAVSVAQVVVDKSRVLLSVANGILEIAKTSLEFAKGVLEAAKLVVEGVKLAIGAAAKVLNFVIEFGVQNLIDVRKCGFEIEMSTKDLPVFEVFCEVNAFRLGWRKITFIVNFKNILQSLWNAARATIESLMKLIGDVIGKKRRDVTFRSAKQVHDILRIIRSADNTTNSETYIYDSLDLTNSIFGFRNGTDSDYENRKILFEGKCVTTTHVLEFLQVAFEELQNVANKSIQTINEIESQKAELEKFTSDGLSDNLTLDTAGINPGYALTDYNITADDLEIALNQTKAELSENPLLQEINDVVNASIQNLNAQLEALYAVDFREAWLLALANLSLDYFNTSECMGFQDCVIYAMSLLYDAFESVDLPNIELTQQTILDVELAFIELFQNESSKITETSASIDNIIVKVYSLQQTNPFCSVAPYFQSEQSDQTMLVGSDVVLLCDASGDPLPVFWWYKDDNLMENEDCRQITLSNVSVNDSGTYYCMAGNIVANISSKESYLLVITHDDDECETNNGGCEQHCENTVGSFKCNCGEGYALNYDGRTCIGGRKEEDTLSANTIALIASMSVLGLVVVAAIGTVVYIKFGKQKMTKVSDLKDRYRDIFVDDFTHVEHIAPGPMKTVFSTHHQFPKGAEAGNIFDQQFFGESHVSSHN